MLLTRLPPGILYRFHSHRANLVSTLCARAVVLFENGQCQPGHPVVITLPSSSDAITSAITTLGQLPLQLQQHRQSIVDQLWEGLSTWFVKRTFQPSIIRKKRKTGFLQRQRTVGGRRTLARRKAKGRWRLAGGI